MHKSLNPFIVYLFVSIFIFSPINSFAQNEFNFNQLKNETLDFAKQPLKWESNDWLNLGLIGAGTFLLIQTDQNIREEMLKNRNYVKSFPIEFGRIYGELYSPIIIAGAFGLNGILSGDKQSKKIGFEIIQTLIYAGSITTGLKLITGRSRPFTDNGSKDFGNWSLLDDQFHSFPSGHTTVAFSISTVLANNTENEWLKVLCYIPAVLTATSRVYQDKHWASDVFLGGIIGYAVGTWVTAKHEENSLVISNSPTQISFSIPLKF